MTTAARPTWTPAQGRPEDRNKAPSLGYSARDLAAHTTLKTRAPVAALKEDTSARAALLKQREALATSHQAKLDKLSGLKLSLPTLMLHPDDEADEASIPSTKAEERHAEDTSDAEEEENQSDRSDYGDDDEDEEDSEDETAALMRELEKIKAERALEQQKLEAERQKQEEEQVLRANPLLDFSSSSSSTSDFKVKRRWDEDVVFRHSGHSAVSGQKQKRFINDLIRSDFHRKFLDKYIK